MKHRDGYSRGGVTYLFLLNVDWSYLTSDWSIAVTCQNKIATPLHKYPSLFQQTIVHSVMTFFSGEQLALELGLSGGRIS